METQRGESAQPEPDGDERRLFVVCGDDTLAFRLAEELVVRYAGEVVVIMPSAEGGQGPRISRLPGVRVVEADRPDADAFVRAGIVEAAALALVERNDGGNVDAALVAREINSQLRIVLRVFSRGLTEGVRATLPGCAVLSPAAMAAPAFVSACLGEGAPTYVRLSDHTLVETRRGEVPDHDVLCGLAAVAGREEPELLPEDESEADVVLAGSLPPGVHGHHQGGRGAPIRVLYRIVGHRLSLAFGVVAAVMLLGTLALAAIKHAGLGEAGYLTILTMFGGPNPDLDASAGEKVVQTLLTVASIALIPLLTAVVVDAMVKARLALATGGVTGPLSDHVIVVGLGDVGTRVIRALHEFNIEAVAIEKWDEARGVTVAKELHTPVIIGDATRAETLRAAYVQTCRALLVVTADDVANLEAALVGRSVNPDLRVVARFFDGEMADRVERAFGITISRSVSYLAAPAFAAAMLGRQVIGTIPLGRRVLLVAELPVGAGSTLEGRPAGEVFVAGQARLLAVRTGRGAQTLWSPPVGRILTRTDRLVVVGTRYGMSMLLARTAAETTRRPPPLILDIPPRAAGP